MSARSFQSALVAAVVVGMASWGWLNASAIAAHASALGNALPADAASALEGASQVTLYSLEDLPRARHARDHFRGAPVLGKVVLRGERARAVVAEFRSAIANSDGSVAACFDPHHALQVENAGRRFDFLICFACGSALVFEGDTRDSLGSVTLGGIPVEMNRLLHAAGVALAYVYSPEHLAAEAEEAREREAAEARWRDSMPPSIRAIWTAEGAFSPDIPFPSRGEETPRAREHREALLAPFRVALRRDFAGDGARIRALLTWLGSGAGPWSGYPAYEEWPESLLFDYDTESIVAAIQQATLSDAQREGSARFFGGWSFRTSRGDLERVPPRLKAELLAHVRATAGDDDDKLARAVASFAP